MSNHWVKNLVSSAWQAWLWWGSARWNAASHSGSVIEPPPYWCWTDRSTDVNRAVPRICQSAM